MEWGDLDIQPKQEELNIDIHSKDYQKMNLNKLSIDELAKHKKAMDKDFEKNYVKPGDSGYQYDKVVDFSKERSAAKDEIEEDDWD